MIPKKNDVSAELVQKHSQKIDHVWRSEVVLLKSNVKSHAFAPGRYAEGGQGGNTIMFVYVLNDRGLSFRTPGSPTRWNEQKAALVEENKVGTKSLDFFL